jgi:hypothetical protein
VTYSAAIARGDGVLEYFLRVDGCKYVFGTASVGPTDELWWKGGFVYHRGLRPGSVALECVAHPGEVWPETSTSEIQIDDPDELVLAYLKTTDGCTSTVLAESVDTTETTISVSDNTGFGSPPYVLHCGLEAWKCQAAPTSTTCTVIRAWHGTRAIDHAYDLERFPPIEPIVADGPGDLRGRRCVLYAAETRDGVLSALETIWIGYVSGWADVRPGMITIPVSHVVRLLKGGEIFSDANAAVGTMTGLWVPNVELARWGRLVLSVHVSGVYTEDVVDIVADGTSEYFASIEDFVDAAAAAIATATSSDWDLGWDAEGSRVVLRYVGSDDFPAVERDRAQAQIVLGFGREVIGHGAASMEADEPPASVFCPTLTHLRHDVRIYLREGEAAAFSTGSVRLEVDGGDTYRTWQILEVNEVDDYLLVAPGGIPADGEGVDWPREVAVRGASHPPTVRQVLDVTASIGDVLRLAWDGGEDLDLPYTFPSSWRASRILQSGDVDFDGFDDLLASYVPAELRTIRLHVDEPTSIGEIITGVLVAAGVYAFVANDGSIAFGKIEIPASAQADLVLDEDLIAANRAPQMLLQYGSEALTNALRLRLPVAGTEEGRQVIFADGDSIQRYGPRVPPTLASLASAAQEITVPVPYSSTVTAEDFAASVGRHLGVGLFGLLGRPRPTAQIPVTPQARSLSIGDVVSVTTQWLWDLDAGSAGVTDKVGLVLGWDRSLAWDGVDTLIVMLFSGDAVVIAPCALATTWTSGTRTLTFLDTDLYCLTSDGSDLDHFAAGDHVALVSYDDTSPTITTGLEVESVSTSTVVLTTAPSVTAPLWLVFDAWTSATTSQQDGGWAWIADDADGEVQGSRDGDEWA